MKLNYCKTLRRLEQIASFQLEVFKKKGSEIAKIILKKLLQKYL